jgi:hypothetical protein
MGVPLRERRGVPVSRRLERRLDQESLVARGGNEVRELALIPPVPRLRTDGLWPSKHAEGSHASAPCKELSPAEIMHKCGIHAVIPFHCVLPGCTEAKMYGATPRPPRLPVGVYASGARLDPTSASRAPSERLSRPGPLLLCLMRASMQEGFTGPG